jgi:very-short-patch-repair endonuclease
MSGSYYNTPREYGERAKALRKQAPLAERLLSNALSKLRVETGLRFRRQHPVPPYFADFACVKACLIIELDGASHDARQAYDARREAALRNVGWTIIRFSNADVEKNLNGVVSTIIETVENRLGGKLSAHP